jgi:xylulokinase
MNDSKAILAVDLGSTWLKAAWVRPDGRIGAITRAESPLRASEPQAQQVWDSVRALICEQIHSADAPRQILALALTGVTRSHVFIDQAGQVLGPLVLWNNPYGEKQAGAVAAAFGTPGQTTGYGAFHPLARLLQFCQETGTRPAAMVELKDWLNFRLTGRLATDSVAYGRIQPGTPGSPALAETLDRLGFPASVIPPTIAPHARLGAAQTHGDKQLERLANVPVIASSFDTWCCTLGMGAVVDGGIYDISGTTEVMGTFGPAPRTVQGMVCLPWTESLWHIGGPCQTGLGTLAWFARAFLDEDDPAATLKAAAASSRQDPPLCIPYLAGERMPWWDSQLTASFQEVRAHHTRGDFAQALVEGLALAHRLAIDGADVLRAGATVHMGGGGTQHPYWCQTRADAFGACMKIGSSAESALVGAALAAGVALGYHVDLPAAQSGINESSTLLRPDPERARYFDSRAMKFSAMLHRTTTP